MRNEKRQKVVIVLSRLRESRTKLVVINTVFNNNFEYMKRFMGMVKIRKETMPYYVLQSTTAAYGKFPETILSFSKNCNE